MFNIYSAIIAMITIVAASNFLVQFPINDWLTWGALPYPVSYLVTEITNYQYGPKKARLLVYIGFTIAIILSFWLSTPKIAIASGLAFLISQLSDIYIFDRFRKSVWWYSLFLASFSATFIDASIFWNLAFYGEDVPLLTWALGDTAIKITIDLLLFLPFRMAIRKNLTDASLARNPF